MPLYSSYCRPITLRIGLIIAGATIVAATPLVADDSWQAQLLVQEAQDNLRVGHLVTGIDKLHQAQRLEPEWIAPHQWLALGYQAAGDKQSAISEYAIVQRRSLADSPGPRRNPAQQEAAVAQCEALTMWLVNDTRRQHGRQLLLPAPRLSQVARQHSLEMRDLGYFSHQSPVDGRENSMKRFESVFGFRPLRLGENCGRRWGTDNFLTAEKITQTHERFLNKPGHRQNILEPQCDHIGVGIAANESGDYWLTELIALYGGN